ncbi:U6 snRNA-associated Sm-like protein LSm2 [Kipferlia bialata]|uniref:U6 snRNA-associated Sm-like protein LSm2 n=1 Tax=Kipferlia bialata TaxID=797122 RepID=A0A391NTJ6_9EUKA|nr:U6 snRNA-associated Sm-like protein LSm2 [Kipferlia bialata]|eukprot:g14243.t1
MLFPAFFRTLIGSEVVVELKSGVKLQGTLQACDDYLNLRMTDVSSAGRDAQPYLQGLQSCFVRYLRTLAS